jgi:hypothetical protein
LILAIPIFICAIFIEYYFTKKNGAQTYSLKEIARLTVRV